MKLTKVILLTALVFAGSFIAETSAGLPTSEHAAYAASQSVKLTDEEKAFIKEHPVIYLAVDPEFVPYEFIDTDGKYKGIAADYIKLISERTGLKMVPSYGLPWEEAYEKAVLKELDVLPCVSKTAEREKNFLYSEPYYSFKRMIFVNENEKEINGFQDLLNRKIAVQRDSSHHSFLKEYPSIELSLYDNVEDALKAVSDGKETAFVGNLAVSNYFMKANGITNLKSIEIESEQNESLYFAVRNDWPVLLGILNKGITSITEEEKLQITSYWLGDQKEVHYYKLIKFVTVAGATIGVILIVSFFWILQLKKEIIARKKMEEALRIAKEEAESANHIKSTFLARMSHEIRTPLNAITGIAYLLLKTDVTVTQKIYLDKITQASANMLGIINDILDYAKIEAGKIQLESISFSLDEILERVVNIESYKMEEEGIEFFMEKDPLLPTYFLGDPIRISQILMNLLNNAIKFTKEGRVSLAVDLHSKEGENNVIQIVVKDTGIGMSEEQIQQLFEPFSQGDSSICRRFGGTGLGLSIVRSLVRMMGGNIRVESKINEGSVFTIFIRLKEDTSKEDFEEKRTMTAILQNLKVLVLDKNKKSRELIKEYLESFFIVADYADREDIADELLFHMSGNDDEKSYDLFILDHDTPKDGGIAFAQTIKDKIGANKPKMILLIPLLKEQLFEQLTTADIDLGITKPIIPSTLYNGILELFNETTMEIESSQKLMENPEEAAFFPCHVLIVEDNKTNQFITHGILEQSGFIVSVEDNGENGYQFYTEHQDEIDVILMDLHMPVMNGYDTAKMIRGINARVPIIAMTADAISGVIEQCMAAGMNEYISKPFDPTKLIETVKKVVRLSRGFRAGKHTLPAGNNDKIVEKAERALDQEDGLRMVEGNTELYQLILKEFYEENTMTLSELEKLINKKDYKEAKLLVHKIKGSSGSIGAKILFGLAVDYQAALERENLDKIKQLSAEFQDQLIQLMIEIKRVIG